MYYLKTSWSIEFFFSHEQAEDAFNDAIESREKEWIEKIEFCGWKSCEFSTWEKIEVAEMQKVIYLI